MATGRIAKLLLSCRDVNGAHQIAPLVREARASRRYDVAVVADRPALDLLRANGVDAIEAAIRPVDGSDRAGRRAAEERAAAVLRETSPDALIAASSGPDGGVDEALVAVHGPASSFVLQDFWGDINETFDAQAGCYFVLDAEAAALTKKRTQARVIVSGMPKYADYAGLETTAMRDAARAALGAAENEIVVSFFGQPLFDTAGYSELIGALVRVIAKIETPVRLVLRAHPRDRSRGIEDARQLARSLNVDCAIDAATPVEPLLAASDAVVSAFSTCCYDAIVLARAAPRPIATAVYFLPDPVWRTYREVTRLDYVPAARGNVALLARTAEELRSAICAAGRPEPRAEIWQRARNTLPDPGDAARLILDSVDATLRRSGHANVRGAA